METRRKTLYEVLLEFAYVSGEKRLFFTDDRSYTVQEVLNEVNRLAGIISSQGINPGDMVALRATRSIDTAILFFALEATGALVVLSDPHNSVYQLPEELVLPVKAYVTSEGKYGSDDGDSDWWFVIDDTRIELNLSDGKRKYEYREPGDTVMKPAVIIFTSGSTGGCKAVTLSQYNLVNHAFNYGYGGCYQETDVSPEMLPLYHVFGLAVLLTAVVHRYEVYFPRDVKPETIAGAVLYHGLTRLDGVPSLLRSVAEYFRDIGIMPPTLRIGVIGGAVINASQFSFIENTLDMVLVPVYGMSECIGISGIPETAGGIDRRLSVGKFLPLNQGCIKDDYGNILDKGEENAGEICVKSPVCMLGYYNNGKLYNDSLDEEGWFHTGDIGYVDRRGFLFIVGRKKDIIIRNGKNISSHDIASKLMTITGVKEVMVVGIPNEKVGELPAALVVTADEERFEKEKDAVLSSLERLGKYCFVKQLPYTHSGKPDRMSAIKMLSE